MISNTAVSKRDGRGKNARNRGKLSHSLLKKNCVRSPVLAVRPEGRLPRCGERFKKWKLPVNRTRA